MRQRGFTLLEAIVAIAVLAVGASALYAWVNTNLKTLQRVDVITERAGLVQSAVELMNTVDPYTQPEGSMTLGDAVVSWQTEKPSYEAPMRTDAGGLGVNDAGLVRAVVTIRREARQVARFEIWLLGIRQVREVSDAIFN
ncbi:MAG TPA: hypothetical protein DCQ80_09575 [Pseudomonas sp.]|nr:hypothetical protein [Pseudomonas sp.]